MSCVRGTVCCCGLRAAGRCCAVRLTSGQWRSYQAGVLWVPPRRNRAKAYVRGGFHNNNVRLDLHPQLHRLLSREGPPRGLACYCYCLPGVCCVLCGAQLRRADPVPAPFASARWAQQQHQQPLPGPGRRNDHRRPRQPRQPAVGVLAQLRATRLRPQAAVSPLNSGVDSSDPPAGERGVDH